MQGFNMGRYYPPDASNAPQFNTSHPLGARANKISQGILTVRFELPFAVWCSHCTPAAIVGQGVRFNAQKKKVGNYYSTPIWSFRMKHTACGGWWEIRTEPKSAEYIVVEGAQRREYGEGKHAEDEGELKFLTEEEREKRRNDAFANLEGKFEERVLLKGNKERLEELYEGGEVWKDDYAVNARLRRGFRAERKVLQREERGKEGIQEKFSLGLEIADVEDADQIRASLIEFGGSGTREESVAAATRRPLFAARESHAVAGNAPKTKKLKAEVLAEKGRLSLQQSLVGNTRASIDPFLSAEAKSTAKIKLGLKRKRKEVLEARAAVDPRPESTVETLEKPLLTAALVDYDSD